MWYVVDTNLLSEPGKPNPDERVVSWLREMRPTCVVAAITLAELRYGLERLPESRRSRALSRQLDRLLEDLERRILPFDEEVAVEWGRYAAECVSRLSSPLAKGGPHSEQDVFHKCLHMGRHRGLPPRHHHQLPVKPLRQRPRGLLRG